MKKFLTLLFIVCFAIPCFSKDTGTFYRWNFELGVGCTGAVAKMETLPNQKTGGMVFAEFRYRLNKKIDLGAYVSATIFERERDTGANHDYKSTNVMVVADWNKPLSRYFTFFAGAGLGVASVDVPADYEYMGGGIYMGDDGKKSLSFMPRAGLQIGRNFRVATGYKFQEKANRHGFFTLSWTFGFKKLK